jgi:hypothetical protein
LKEGAKLAFVFFKGRSIIYKDQGQIIVKISNGLRKFGKSRSYASS